MSDILITPTAYLQAGLAQNPEFCIVVEYQRYIPTKESPTDGWVFYWLVPDQNGSETPFSPPLAKPYQEMTDAEVEAWAKADMEGALRGCVDGWMDVEIAEIYRANLEPLGFTKVPWDQVPEQFRSYVRGNVLPYGWGEDEEFCKAQTTIHIKGEWPA